MRALTTFLTAMASDAPSAGHARRGHRASTSACAQATRFTCCGATNTPGLIGERYLLTNLGAAALALGIPLVRARKACWALPLEQAMLEPASQHQRVCIAGRDAHDGSIRTQARRASRAGIPPKARQWLLPGGLLVGALRCSTPCFALTDSPKTNARPAAAKPAVTTHVQAPGAQVDARGSLDRRGRQQGRRARSEADPARTAQCRGAGTLRDACKSRSRARG